MHPPQLDPDIAAFLPLAQEFASAFRGCVVRGQIARDAASSRLSARGLAGPFAEAACRCGQPLAMVSQFWKLGRLWRYDFCLHCDAGAGDGLLRSAPASASMPDGAFVEGNSHWALEEADFLQDSDSSEWQAALEAAGLTDAVPEDDQELFFEALALTLGCANAADDPRHGLTHLGGVPSWIQWKEEVHCPECGKAMPFLAQLEDNTGFHWGDAGAAYLFACPEHPELGGTAQQMC